MDNFLQQDIFFFVTTIAVVTLTILLTVLLVYLIVISRKINYIADKVKAEADLLSAQLQGFRNTIKTVFRFLAHLGKGRGKRGKE
jgi:hypothetical protein